jgi:hypothetical protein
LTEGVDDVRRVDSEGIEPGVCVSVDSAELPDRRNWR